MGRAFFEIYAAPGAFDVDSASDAWALIGSPEGFQIVSGTPLSLGTVTKTIDQVTIDFVSPNPDGTYTLLESLDLQSWTSVPAAVFAKTGGNGVRVTLNGVTGGKRFYRVALPN